MSTALLDGTPAFVTFQIPDGYVRYDGSGSPVNVIEKDNQDTIR